MEAFVGDADNFVVAADVVVVGHHSLVVAVALHKINTNIQVTLRVTL